MAARDAGVERERLAAAPGTSMSRTSPRSTSRRERQRARVVGRAVGDDDDLAAAGVVAAPAGSRPAPGAARFVPRGDDDRDRRASHRLAKRALPAGLRTRGAPRPRAAADSRRRHRRRQRPRPRTESSMRVTPAPATPRAQRRSSRGRSPARGAPSLNTCGCGLLDRVPRVDDQIRLRHHRVVVERLVVGEDDDAVGTARTSPRVSSIALDVEAARPLARRAAPARTDPRSDDRALLHRSSAITSSAGDSRMSSMSRL